MPEKRAEVATIEKLIENVKPFGPFQMGYMALLQLQALFYTCVVIFVSFALLEPAVRCHDHVPSPTNATHQCYVTETLNCTNITLEHKDGFFSLRSHYPELIVSSCEDSIRPILFFMSVKEVVFGVLSMFTGFLPDLFGRKPMILATTACITLGAFGCAFSSSFYGQFIPFWLVISFGFALVGTATSSLGSEYTLSKYRLSINAAQTWALSYPLLAIFAYFSRDYRILFLIGGCLGIPVFAGFLFYSESPRWLLVRKQYDGAAVALNRMAWVNGASVRYTGEQLRKELDVNQPKTSVSVDGYLVSWYRDMKTIGHVLRNKKLLAFLLFISWHYLSAGAIGMNFIVNAGDLNWSSYLSVACVGLFRIWTPFMIIGSDLYLPRFGRRAFVLVSFALTTVPIAMAAVFSIAAYYEGNDHTKEILTTAVAVCAIFSTAMSFGLLFFAIWQVAIEVFPTVTRSGAMSVISIAGTVAGALGPQVTRLNQIWPPLQFVLATICFLISLGMAFVMLPETKHKPLPDRLEDVDLVLGGKKKKKEEKMTSL